jgi:hypothetical protein
MDQILRNSSSKAHFPFPKNRQLLTVLSFEMSLCGMAKTRVNIKQKSAFL